MLTLRPLPPQRRECPNPRTPYCHYYYNLKEDRQIEMRDMETTVKVPKLLITPIFPDFFRFFPVFPWTSSHVPRIPGVQTEKMGEN